MKFKSNGAQTIWSNTMQSRSWHLTYSLIEECMQLMVSTDASTMLYDLIEHFILRSRCYLTCHQRHCDIISRRSAIVLNADKIQVLLLCLQFFWRVRIWSEVGSSGVEPCSPVGEVLARERPATQREEFRTSQVSDRTWRSSIKSWFFL